ncbi:MAG: 4Fe-4S binding protein [Planctomycetes bacterium]|nr:4Fe-4S binding protein [Planctomycetota bacterium]
MKIAVTAQGPSLDDDVDPRFGRCAYFLVVDTESQQFEAVENPNLAAGHGAGIQSAQMIAERGASAVLTGNCGPNAYETLRAAGIDVVVGVSGSIRGAVERFETGTVAPTAGPNVAGHFGTGAAGSSANPGPGKGRGLGMGGGRGGGMGRGRGMGRRGGAPFGAVPAGADEIADLRAQADMLSAELQAIRNRMAQIEGTPRSGRMVAIVDDEKCTACGRCETVCPVEAISVDKVAAVDANTCTGCGLCIDECPVEAIHLGHP